jgi:hypothetical protein
MKSTLAFVYLWIHMPTQKWYIGSRTQKGCHPMDGYICSSKTVKPLITEDLSSWQRLILKTGEPQDMVELETKLLQILDAKQDPMSFNQHNGDGKFTVAGKKVYRSSEQGAKISAANKGRTAWNKGLNKNTDVRVAQNAASISKALTGRPGIACSADKKAKISATERTTKLRLKELRNLQFAS